MRGREEALSGETSPWRPRGGSDRFSAMVSAARFARPARRAVLVGSALGILWGASGCAVTNPDYLALKGYFSGQEIVEKTEVKYNLGVDRASFIEAHLRLKNDAEPDSVASMLQGASRKVGEKADVRIWIDWHYSGALVNYATTGLGLWKDADQKKPHELSLLEWATEIAQGRVQSIDVPSMSILYEAQDELPEDFVLNAQKFDSERVKFESRIALPGWDVDIQATSDDDMSDFPLKKILSSIPDPGPQGLRHRLAVDTYWNAKDGPYLNIGNRQSNDDGLSPIGKGSGNGRDLAARLIRAIRGAPVVQRVLICLEDPAGPRYPETESFWVSMADGVITGPTFDTDDYSRRLLTEILG